MWPFTLGDGKFRYPLNASLFIEVKERQIDLSTSLEFTRFSRCLPNPSGWLWPTRWRTWRKKTLTGSATGCWTTKKNRRSDGTRWRARPACRWWTSWCPRSRSPGPCAWPWSCWGRSSATRRLGDLVRGYIHIYIICIYLLLLFYIYIFTYEHIYTYMRHIACCSILVIIITPKTTTTRLLLNKRNPVHSRFLLSFLISFSFGQNELD